MVYCEKSNTNECLSIYKQALFYELTLFFSILSYRFCQNCVNYAHESVYCIKFILQNM